MARDLANAGFENIVARTSERLTLVAFEDSRYRYSIRGMQEGLVRTIYRLPASSKKVVALVKKYDVPIVAFESTDMMTITSSCKPSFKVPLLRQSHVLGPLARALSHWPETHSSRFKTDVILHPDFKASLGEYDNPVAVQLNLKPEIRMLLAKGLLFSGSFLVPLVNELEPRGDYVRLGPTHLNYLGRLPRQMFWFINLGYFLDDRYGVQAGLRKYTLEGLLQFDARIGYTGYGAMDNGVFLYDPPQELTYSLSGTYFIRKLQLFIKAGYNQFIYQDRGFSFELSRFFRDFRFGMWASTSNHTYNGGFRLSIPLPPRKYAVRQWVRVRPASYFELGYLGKRNTTAGRQLRANELFDDMLMRHHPAYLESNLGRLQSKERR